MAGNAVASAALLAAVACGGSTEPDDPAPATLTVNLLAERFDPETGTVAVGGTVTFVNVSGDEHDVDFGTPQLRIDAFSSGQRSLTFPTAGRFAYHCNLHAGMEATLVVR